MANIVTYNINGLRSGLSKGFLAWIDSEKPDVVCLQETKVLPHELDLSLFTNRGYQCYFHPAEKKGYSGVAILTKIKPDNVLTGCGESLYDCEGRFIRADYGDISVLSVYFPSGSSGEERQDFKMGFLSFFTSYIQELRKTRPGLIISGDYNICNKAIDIHNPAGNKNTSGFLPEEREWFDQFLASGFTDAFRHFNDAPNHYTWWSFRANARAKNLGWRIDYNLVSDSLKDRLVSSRIMPDARHSDHCPCEVQITIP